MYGVHFDILMDISIHRAFKRALTPPWIVIKANPPKNIPSIIAAWGGIRRLTATVATTNRPARTRQAMPTRCLKVLSFVQPLLLDYFLMLLSFFPLYIASFLVQRLPQSVLLLWFLNRCVIDGFLSVDCHP